jgi:chromosomal replication initiation ATPase DnaA
MLISQDTVFSVVSHVTKVSIEELLKKKRTQRIFNAKMLLRYFLFLYSDLNKVEIGKITGTDHSNVISSLKKLKRTFEEKEKKNQNYETLFVYYLKCSEIFNDIRMKKNEEAWKTEET